ncbi:protein translocase subunit SecF [Jannaschia formosa]|uniref:protein translocase subunit SecF n=1 Tax=Jannaschia formosa TaxID=2259592 RepID=UPI001FD8407C|nr:protein translocase subunit SecF [Jannaschia formosa]
MKLPIWRFALAALVILVGVAVALPGFQPRDHARSLPLPAVSLGLFVSPGLNYGVDFRGGALIEASTGANTDLAALRHGVETLGLRDISPQESDGGSSVLTRVEEQPGGEAAQTGAAEAVRAVIAEVAPEAQIDRVEIVGPRVSAGLAVAGFLPVAAASLGIGVYIWARFDWPYAVGAIATLVLDITKTVGFLALTSRDFGRTAIAALLTLIGFSVNGKVVVYDRMRENSERHPAMPMRELIDLSIDQTLARSLCTFCTALLAMLPMAVWGGAAVQSFAIPMVFGIVVAASSSIFIAAPILLFLGDWRHRNAARAEPGPVVRLPF